MARKKKEEIVKEEVKETVEVAETPVAEIEPADEPVEEAGVEETPAEPEAEAEEAMKTEVVDFDNEVKIDAGFARGAQALQRALLRKKGRH